MTPEERIAAYPKGALVRVKPDQVEGFTSDEARKLKDRIGVVSGHTAFSGHPIVLFPALGRRTEHRRSFTFAHTYLDVIVDETEVVRWPQTWADDKTRRDKALAKKRAEFQKKATPAV